MKISKRMKLEATIFEKHYSNKNIIGKLKWLENIFGKCSALIEKREKIKLNLRVTDP